MSLIMGKEPDTKPSTVAAGTKRLTVLQVLPALGPQGGVERGAVDVAAAIVAAGGRALVASAGGVLTHELLRVGAEPVPLPLDRKSPWVIHANIERLSELIRRENVDIVHARSRAPGWSAYFAAKRTQRPFVTTFHGTYSVPNWFKRVYNSVMAKGDPVIAISAFIAGHVRQHYGVPAPRIRTIHRGVDLDRFDVEAVTQPRVIKLAGEWRLTDGLPVVMLPGRLTRWKGQTVLLEALARLGRKDLRALLIGEDQGRVGYRCELERLIEKHELGGVVRIIDHCNDMPAAYMLADVVVSASTDPEAFGRVVAEAQALGRPVIATDHGGARETVIPGLTGWLTPPGDPDALARAIEESIGLSAEARQQFANTAIAHIRANFSKRVMCDKTLAVYQEVMGRGAAS